MGGDHADVDDDSDCTDGDDYDDEEFTTLEERNMREPSYVCLDDNIIIDRLIRPSNYDFAVIIYRLLYWFSFIRNHEIWLKSLIPNHATIIF